MTVPDSPAVSDTGPDSNRLVAASLLRSAIVFLEQGEYEQAEKSLRQALARVPEQPDCLGELAYCLAVGQHKFVTAERLAKRAVQVAPTCASGYFALGRINVLGERRRPAHKFLMYALKLSPEDPRIASALRALGRRRPPVIPALPRGHPLNVGLGRLRAYLSSGPHLALIAALVVATILSVVSAAYSATPPPLAADFDLVAHEITRLDSLLAVGEALAVVSRADLLLQVHGKEPELAWQFAERKGVALLKLGRHADALEPLEFAVRAMPDAATVHLNLATALIALEQKGRAFAEFQRAATLDPGNWRACLDYGQALLLYGQTTAAERQLEEANRICGECPEAQRALGRLYLARDEFSRACEPLARVWAVRPQRDVRLSLALALMRSGDAERARELLAPFWPDSLEDAERRLLLEADREVGDRERAVVLVASLGRAPPEPADPELWALAALICHDGGDDGRALLAIDAAVSLSPREVRYRHNRVAFLERLGRRAEADAEWRRVLELDPASAGKRH